MAFIIENLACFSIFLQKKSKYAIIRVWYSNTRTQYIFDDLKKYPKLWRLVRGLFSFGEVSGHLLIRTSIQNTQESVQRSHSLQEFLFSSWLGALWNNFSENSKIEKSEQKNPCSNDSSINKRITIPDHSGIFYYIREGSDENNWNQIGNSYTHRQEEINSFLNFFLWNYSHYSWYSASSDSQVVDQGASSHSTQPKDSLSAIRVTSRQELIRAMESVS